MRFSKAMSLMAIVMLIGCTAVAYAGTPRADKFPCELIKGKTYISWMSGTFDGANSVSSGKIIFDKDGKGSTYEFSMQNTASTSNLANVLKRNVTCIATPAGRVSVDGSPVGKWSLSYPEGLVFITSYGKGAKIWLNYAERHERVNKGWMFQLPSTP